MRYGYPDLHAIGWRYGVHRAPVGYEHPWVVVAYTTDGYWSRAEARKAWRRFGPVSKPKAKARP